MSSMYIRLWWIFHFMDELSNKIHLFFFVLDSRSVLLSISSVIKLQEIFFYGFITSLGVVEIICTLNPELIWLFDFWFIALMMDGEVYVQSDLIRESWICKCIHIATWNFLMKLDLFQKTDWRSSITVLIISPQSLKNGILKKCKIS